MAWLIWKVVLANRGTLTLNWVPAEAMEFVQMSSSLVEAIKGNYICSKSIILEKVDCCFVVGNDFVLKVCLF